MIAQLETTITVKVTVEYEYEGAEPEVRYYANGDGHPGCPASATILSIKAGNVEIPQDQIEDDLDDLETACIEHAESMREEAVP